MNRVKYIITGIVQGVGFRPFVYKIATNLNLKGFVQNTNEGVIIEIEGSSKVIDGFENALKNNLPPLSKIITIDKKELNPLHYKEFKIIKSQERSLIKSATVPPDIAICSECKKDITQIKKYKNYFATNCTNCGPRYTIIKTIPYDRKNTSMQKFTLCNSCKSEFEDLQSRRFHAQAISCVECGPKLTLIENVELRMKNIYKNTANLIKSGKIGAIKGIGGFHIVCDATNDEVLKRLREFKNRPSKPFALMCKNIEQIREFAVVSKKEEEALKSKEAPIVVLQKLKNQTKIADSIAPKIDKVGCFLPYSALHLLLFEYLSNPIVATSANLGGGAIIADAKEIKEKLNFVDFIVDFNRDIVNRIDDSVVQIIDNEIFIIRLSRGFAPKEIVLDKKIDKKILCLGANSKNSISLLFDNKLIISPYIGDLSNIEGFEFFKRTIKSFKNFYDFKPDLIVCDKHPSYESSKFAKQLEMSNEKLEIFKVQHHLAHLYSVKAEYHLKGKDYIGFIFDGTGFGEDNTLWGGEVFVKEKREYFFKPIKLLGGEIAIKEPRRVALSYLFEKYSLNEVLNLNLPTIKAFSKNEIILLHKMWQKNINIAKTSSVGRLFDMVASLAGVIQKISYEGESGIKTEAKVDDSKLKNLDSFKYHIKNSQIIIDFDIFDRDLITKFYATIIKIVLYLSKAKNLPIILSGGVFQNKILLENLIHHLKKQDLKYYFNRTIPANDGGVSAGQGYYLVSN